MAKSGNVSIKVTSWNKLRFNWEVVDWSYTDLTSTIEWSLVLIAEGTSGTIESTASKNWTVTIDGKTFSGTNSVGIQSGANGAEKTLASGKVTIKHNSDGRKSFTYSFSQQFDITFSGSSIGTKSYSDTETLDQIAVASTLTVADGTLGTAQTLTISKAASTYKHKLTYSCGSASGYILGSASSTSTASSVSFTPPKDLAKQNTTGSTVSIKFTLTTYIGDDTAFSSKSYTKTFTIPSTAEFNPSCSIEVTDPTGYKSEYGKAIKGLSKLKIVVKPKLAYNSEIDSYKITANGETYTTASATTGVLIYSGTVSITATVTDERGRTGTATFNETVYDYAPPAVSKLHVKRCNSDGVENNQGAFVQVTLSGSATSLDGKNAAKYTLRYKKSSESDYITISSTTLSQLGIKGNVTDGTYIFAADTESSYDVIVDIADNFQTTSRFTSASTAYVLLDFGANGKSIGVGKVAEGENTFEVGFNSEFYGNVSGKALGLGALPTMEETDNANNYTEAGCWCVPTNAQATAMNEAGLNIPSKNAGRFIVVNGTGWDDPATEYKYRLQFYFPYLSSLPAFVRHIRKTDTSAWIYGTWKNISGAVEIPFEPVDGVTVTRCTVSFNNDIVTMCFSGKYSSAITAGTTKQIGTIAEAGRPEKSVVTCGLQGSGIAACWVTNTGVVNIRPITAYTASTVIEFNLTWNVEAAWQ